MILMSDSRPHLEVPTLKEAPVAAIKVVSTVGSQQLWHTCCKHPAVPSRSLLLLLQPTSVWLQRWL
jgi:hypothetical protein